MVVAICTKFVHPEPWQRSIRYAATPTLSFEAVQARLILEDDEALAVRFVGAVGGVVSVAGAGATVNPELELAPSSEAVIVTVVLPLALTACALNVACEVPAGTVTEPGTDIVAPLPA